MRSTPRIVSLPEGLNRAIQREISHFSIGDLSEASKNLTAEYRANRRLLQVIQTELGRAAYLVTRMPATFAATSVALSHSLQRTPKMEIRSILDLGGGSGGSLWAAAHLISPIEQATVIDLDAKLLEVGRRLAEKSLAEWRSRIEWISSDITNMERYPQHDLVLIAYSLGELQSADRPIVVEKAMQAASKLCVIIEPGSRKGFEHILTARSTIIDQGGHIVAPCAAAIPCPLSSSNRWCHFSQRLTRSSLHRKAKEAELGYEDEKYAYIVATRQNQIGIGENRVLQTPHKSPRKVLLTLCTPKGRIQVWVPKSQKSAYRLARHVKWGDTIGSDELADLVSVEKEV